MNKRILFLSAMLCCLTGLAQNQITALVTITNNPTVDQTLVVNGTTKTWKSSIGAATTQVQTAASIGASFTNLVRHLRLYPIPSTSFLEVSGSTNAFRIYGNSGASLSVAASGWATIAYTTNRTASQAKDHVVVADLEDMQALRPSITRSVTIQYHTALNDGGGGTFIASSDSLTDDGGTIIASELEAGWYWVRQYTGDVFPEWWGANGADSGDDSAAFNEALSNFKDISLLPNRHYKADITITGQDIKLSVAGGTTKLQSFSTNAFAITVGNNSTATGNIKISNIEFHGGLTNNFGIKIRGGVDGLTLKDCEFSRFKGIGLHIMGESTSAKNIRIVGLTATQGVEADDDLIQIDQSSSNNVIGVSFTDCQGTSNEDDNNLLLIDSVVVTMSNCRWDVGTAGAKIRLNKSQTTAPIIYGGQSTITSEAGTAAIKIGYTPATTAVGTLVPNILLTGDLEYNDASTTTWSGMAQPQFSSLQFLTATPEGSLTGLAGSLAAANLSGVPNLYIKGKTATLNNANWVNVLRDRYVDAYGAVGDLGVTDDTAAIQAAVDLGGRIVFSRGKIYRITSAIEFTVPDTHLYFEEGAEILADCNSYAILCDEVLDNISVINGTVRMNGAKGGNNHGIYTISKSRSFYLRDCVAIATNSALDGLAIGMNGFSTSQGASGKFENCVASGTTKSGYHISTGSEHIQLINCISTNNINTNTGTWGHTPGFDTSGSFIDFINCKSYDTGGPGFLLSADGVADPGTNSCADNVLLQNCETWNAGVASSSSEGWGLAVRSAFTEWPTNITVRGLIIYNPYNAALKLQKGEHFDISDVRAYNVRFIGIASEVTARNIRLTNIYMDGDESNIAGNYAFFSSGGTNYNINNFEIKDFGKGLNHTSGTPLNDVSISGYKYSNVTTPFLFSAATQVTNGHWQLRGPWTTPNSSTHGAAPDGSVWYNTTAGATNVLHVKVNGSWTFK